MKILSIIFGAVVFILSFTNTNAQTDQEWIDINDPEELRNLISGRSMDARYWAYFFRADGKMSYWQDGYDFISVREWTIKENGDLCLFVYSRPDHIIDCPKIQKTSTSPVQYRHKGATGNQIVRFMDPTSNLIDAITKTAGAE